MSKLVAMGVAVGALLALAGAALWVILQEPVDWSRLQREHASGAPRPGRDLPVFDHSGAESFGWERRGGVVRWSQDLFTPPTLFVNPETLVLSELPVRPEPGMAETSWSVELLAVKAEAFPLQLVGYLGADETTQGVFERVATGENILARAGHHFTALGLTLRAFEVQLQREGSEGSAVMDRAAIAWLVNDVTGEEVRLTSRERHYEGRPEATLRLLGGEVIQVRQGDEFHAAGDEYVVASITRTPASAVLIRRFPGKPDVETRTLIPRFPDTASSPP